MTARLVQSRPGVAERAWLEGLHRRYHHRRYVHPDPLEFLYGYDDLGDREIVALIASSLAYGNVTAMLVAIEDVLSRLGPGPSETIATASRRSLAGRLRGFRYRFTTGRQLTGLLIAVQELRRRHGGMQPLLLANLDRGDETILPALTVLVETLHDESPCPLSHLVPSPRGGSACKRLNLLLRWMVRRDDVDPGGWSDLPPRLLVMPLDTHVFRTALDRGWTRRRTPDLKTAVEITRVLRALRPDDPLRYDFAITRPGIRGTKGLDVAPP